MINSKKPFMSPCSISPSVARSASDDAAADRKATQSHCALPLSAGKLVANAPLAPYVWFRSGGAADWLFAPSDCDDLSRFMAQLDSRFAVMALGLGSNLIIRDGGVEGVVIRLGKAFAHIEAHGANILYCGGGASGIAMACAARDAAIGGLEFLRGIPGTLGGLVRMNAGAYGREIKNVLINAEVVLRSGKRLVIECEALGFDYRRSKLPSDCVVVAARLRGYSQKRTVIQSEMDRIAAVREASQPLRTRTGGSTFKNPAPKNPAARKAWQFVDAAGCRGLQLGGAKVSEKHSNFLIGASKATSADIEQLGEEVRRRVKNHSGLDLQWEIQRVGRCARNDVRNDAEGRS